MVLIRISEASYKASYSITQNTTNNWSLNEVNIRTETVEGTGRDSIKVR